MLKTNSVFIFFLLLVSSCTSTEPKEVTVDYATVKKHMIERNKVWHNEEMEDIEAFVKRHNWAVTTTGTGLKYVIYKKADTTLPCIKEGMVARINYTISLLNDSICYASEGEPDEFMVGMDDVESGLHEAVTYMRKGEKAKIILSSNLAFGLVGDMDQIPPQSPLVYDIELVDIIDPQTKQPYDKKKNHQ